VSGTAALKAHGRGCGLQSTVVRGDGWRHAYGQAPAPVPTHTHLRDAGQVITPSSSFFRRYAVVMSANGTCGFLSAKLLVEREDEFPPSPFPSPTSSDILRSVTVMTWRKPRQSSSPVRAGAGGRVGGDGCI
jgi:hypothetical protein